MFFPTTTSTSPPWLALRDYQEGEPWGDRDRGRSVPPGRVRRTRVQRTRIVPSCRVSPTGTRCNGARWHRAAVCAARGRPLRGQSRGKGKRGCERPPFAPRTSSRARPRWGSLTPPCASFVRTRGPFARALRRCRSGASRRAFKVSRGSTDGHRAEDVESVKRRSPCPSSSRARAASNS